MECSLCWLTSRSAPAAGPHDGMTSVRPVISPSTSTSKLLAMAKLAHICVKRWGRMDHSLAYAPPYLYHIDRHQNAALIPQLTPAKTCDYDY